MTCCKRQPPDEGQCYNIQTQVCCGGRVYVKDVCKVCDGSSYVDKCDPDQCEKCVDGACISDACYLDRRDADYTGIKCACEDGACKPPGSILHDYFCNVECYGNCHCEVTMGLQVVEEEPICEDISEEPGCVDTSDCKFTGWNLILDVAPAICNCEHN